MEKKLEKGLFITFEGPEGSGKSTQSSRLCEDLESSGYEVMHTLEPGGTLLGKRIREVLLEKDDISLGKVAELFLFEADRAQHVEEIILPALEEGKIVVCDRFNAATFAYQGYGLGMDLDFIKKADKKATQGLSPDLTILLDIDIETGLARAIGEHDPDRMEKRSRDFHEKVRQGYLAQAKESPEMIKVIEVSDDIEGTYGRVRGMVFGLLERSFKESKK